MEFMGYVTIVVIFGAFIGILAYDSFIMAFYPSYEKEEDNDYEVQEEVPSRQKRNVYFYDLKENNKAV